MKKNIILSITGASGVIYGVRLFEILVENFCVHLILSRAGEEVLKMEMGLTRDFFCREGSMLYSEDQISAPPASGSWIHEGMIICPCSMATLGAIANGIGNNLIHRSADVTLKEKRKLILVTRESPLNIIHIKNMLNASRAGAIIFPASPGFYTRPSTIGDLINHLVSRILDQLQIKNNLSPRWEGNIF